VTYNRIHFIAIGGAAMHNLAIALKKKGYHITGSDDEIFEPSLSRLKDYGLLPERFGWFPEKITNKTDAVILGMHACNDNPELVKAHESGIKIYSYPEFLYEQTKDKKRIVIGGSHGKTTITSMIMHVLRACGRKFDYMVGSRIKGFDTMVELSEENKLAIFEGDEYLSSPIDLRPKFHLYKPHIGVINGIAWDHMNVFPTKEIYDEQFAIFVRNIEPGGIIIYCEDDQKTREIVLNNSQHLEAIGYTFHRYKSNKKVTLITGDNKEVEIRFFGRHNMYNVNAAFEVCKQVGITNEEFYASIATFEGSAKRLQVIHENSDSVVLLDFAHSPSKLKATVSAVREKYREREIIACFELHTYSSLNKDFLEEYRNTLDDADRAVVLYNPEAAGLKKLDPIDPGEIIRAFQRKDLEVITDKTKFEELLGSLKLKHKVLLLMSSGNFFGCDIINLTTS
jgi:UDP-N-acetylmuramate: L-alanyl-gamma-D-glutamyl-meso-diaminopimelate ligase